MTLLDVHDVAPVKVLNVECGCGFSRNLACLGIHAGDLVSVVRKAPFSGPVLVRVEKTGANIAVGRDMASRITVETDNSSIES
jgi:ferrous iron transport protein A